MIALWSGSCSATRIDSPSPGKLSNASYQQDRSLECAWAGALPFLVALEVGRKPPSSSANPAMSFVHGGGTARMGTKAKPLAAYRRRLCCLWAGRSIQDHQNAARDQLARGELIARSICQTHERSIMIFSSADGWNPADADAPLATPHRHSISKLSAAASGQ